jgi:hypothetical protein
LSSICFYPIKITPPFRRLGAPRVTLAHPIKSQIMIRIALDIMNLMQWIKIILKKKVLFLVTIAPKSKYHIIVRKNLISNLESFQKLLLYNQERLENLNKK